MTQRIRRHRPSLWHAIDWIAYNDETAEMEPEIIAQSISVLLVADVWKREPMEIARKVLWRRRQEQMGERIKQAVTK